MRNIQLKIILVLAIMVASTPVFAQGSGSGAHGGSGLICNNKVELAEFKEVQVRPGLAAKVKINYSDKSVDEQIAEALMRVKVINYPLGLKLESYVNDIRFNALPINNYDWGFSNDVNFYPAIAGCELKTVVYYLADEMIEYQLDLYSRMSKTDQAGLWVHEAVYRLNRELQGANGTLMTRRIVAALFDPNIDQRLLSGLLYKHLASPKNKILIEVTSEQVQKGVKFKADSTSRAVITLNDQKLDIGESRKIPRQYIIFKTIPQMPIKMTAARYILSEGPYFDYTITVLSNDEVVSSELSLLWKKTEYSNKFVDTAILFLDPSVRLFELGK